MKKKNYIIFLFWFFRILLLTVTVDIYYSRLPKSENPPSYWDETVIVWHLSDTVLYIIYTMMKNLLFNSILVSLLFVCFLH